MGESWAQIETIIDQALTLPQEKREPFINETCGDNKSLKSEVTQLLQSIADSEGWLENPNEYKEEFLEEIADDVDSLDTSRSLVGNKIGSYKIKKKLGEGGMGMVYLAERADDEFKHRVAIKVIRKEKASAENIRRFEQERTILAGLNHSGIAKLFDGGITDDGSPYFIMEFVDGIPIDQYCQKHNSTIEECISLFKQVLKAVRHAHENLIVHRDLKPGNILINTSGKVKILDFGISKFMEDDQASQPQLTQTNVRPFTPKYAAPEQVLRGPITTATDIYALGIIFYSLISGTQPYNLDDLSPFEMEQTILKSNPERPSAKAESAHSKNQLKGDLDAIALKAIRKESDQRYRTADNFLDDLNRFKDGLPVQAREGSANYRFKKFIKRNKNPLIAATLFFVSITGITGFYTNRLNQQRQAAENEAQKSLEVKNLLVDLFEANDPILSDENTITLKELLKKGTDELLNTELDPAIRIELIVTLANIYQNISNFDKASQLAKESVELSLQHFGPSSKEAAKSYLAIGDIEHDLGNYKTGKKYFLKAQTILMNELPESDPLIGRLYHNLGYSEEKLSNYEDSKTYFKKSLQNIKAQPSLDSTAYITELRNVARSHNRSGATALGDSLLKLALTASNKIHGKKDIVTSSVMNDLGLFNMTQANYDEAKNYFQQSLIIKENVYGDKGHSNFSATLSNLAVLEETLGNFQAAESLYQRSLNMDQKLLSKDHPYVTMSKKMMGELYFKMQKYEASRDLLEEALNDYLEIYGSDHSYLGSLYKNYGRTLSILGEYETAETYFAKADSNYQQYRNSTRDFARLAQIRGTNYYKMGQYTLAIPQLEAAAKKFHKIEPRYFAYMRRAAECRIKLGQSYLNLGKTDKAKSIFANLASEIDTVDALRDYSRIKRLYSNATSNL